MTVTCACTEDCAEPNEKDLVDTEFNINDELEAAETDELCERTGNELKSLLAENVNAHLQKTNHISTEREI